MSVISISEWSAMQFALGSLNDTVRSLTYQARDAMHCMLSQQAIV